MLREVCKETARTKSGRRAARSKASAVPQSWADEIGGADLRLGDEGVEIARVILEPIGDVRLARLPEADQVRGDAMGNLGDEGNDVAPDIGGGRIAVQEERDRLVRPPASR